MIGNGVDLMETRAGANGDDIIFVTRVAKSRVLLGLRGEQRFENPRRKSDLLDLHPREVLAVAAITFESSCAPESTE